VKEAAATTKFGARHFRSRRLGQASIFSSHSSCPIRSLKMVVRSCLG
jgi:hypothetical protein